jgi:hypothetical protein
VNNARLRWPVWIVLFLSVAGAGCAKKNDCEAYSEHMAKFAASERVSTVRFSARQACDKGRVTAEQIACTLRTTSSAAAYACHGP